MNPDQSNSDRRKCKSDESSTTKKGDYDSERAKEKEIQREEEEEKEEGEEKEEEEEEGEESNTEKGEIRDDTDEMKTRRDAETCRAMSLLPSKYRKQHKIASGAFSDVWRVVDDETHCVYAVKTIFPLLSEHRKHETEEQRVKKADEEDAMWARLQHDNLLPRIAAFVDGPFRVTLAPFCNGGDLFAYLDDNFVQNNSYRFTDIGDSEHVLVQLFSALDYLHNRMHMVHRDIKPENILVHFDGGVEGINYAPHDNRFCNSRLLLADFTFLAYLDGNADGCGGADALTDACGTCEYIAPEIFRCESYGCTVDCWSAGIVIYECCEGVHPFINHSTNNCARIRSAVLNRRMLPFEHKKENVEFYRILARLLDKVAANRFTARQVIDECARIGLLRRDDRSSALSSFWKSIARRWSAF